MIDLTPLDVRNKRGDFKKSLRGYDTQEVDLFLELVAERLEALVRENMRLRERSQTLEQQVSSQSGRERAVQEALVTAQELRSDIRTQAQREAQLILEEGRAAARRLTADAERRVQALADDLEELERRRGRFLKAFRQLLEREMDVVEVEAERAPLDDRTIEIELGGGKLEEGAEEAWAGSDEAVVWEVDSGEPVQGASVDGSAEARPPLDASVDELAAAYESSDAALDEADSAGERGTKSARDLVLPRERGAREPERGSSPD